MKLERSKLEPDRYNYLSKEDSDLYDKHKDQDDVKSLIICKLIKRLAGESYAAHCNDIH